MRHGNKNNNLSRTASHRKALLGNLASQLFQYKRIVTTLAKAKALRPYVEPLITKAKENTTHQRRLVFSHLQDKDAVKELFDVISAKTSSRPGGYTRVVKLGKRIGDNAELAMIELVDYNEIYGKGIGEIETAAKKTRRAGRSKKAGTSKVQDEEKEIPKLTNEKTAAKKTVPVETSEDVVPVEEPEDKEPEVKA